MSELVQALLALIERNDPCATATIVSASGSIPNAVGAQMLVDGAGRRVAGTVGGGAIEQRAIAECTAAIAAGEHRRFTFQLTDEQAGGIGMMCGGKAEIFVHVHRPAAQLVLVGGGHINIEIARIAARLGYAVTVVDDREDWASADNYPDARIINEEPATALARVDWSADSFVVIATRDRDIDALRAAITRPCRYIGVVASRRKALTLLRQLQQDGIELGALLPRLFVPIGLATGGRSPQAIAISVMAEIEQLRHGAEGGHLRVDAEQWQALAARRSA